ncbi:hypothetical protein [Streptomyces sp. NPDC093093]|uniref:hypothetical protein n=1 Tax=Streptomyces sp. NPDC093093 TaxID=3366025 RepID=UPI00381720CC
MLDLHALAQTPEIIGYDKGWPHLLTVRDMYVLAEVAALPEAEQREAARHALTLARLAASDNRDNREWTFAVTWAPDQRRAPVHRTVKARRVLDCDGRLWEQRHTFEDGDRFDVDAWSPLTRTPRTPVTVYPWAELVTHYGPLTEMNSSQWPQQPPMPEG